MKTEKTLGSEIQRLRTEAGFTLRGFALKAEISAAFLSDIERDRRRPSEEYFGALQSSSQARLTKNSTR